MNDKEALLKELEALGIHRSGRKVRTDKGKEHPYVRKTKLPRLDKGLKRVKYDTTSAAYHKKVFVTFLRSNTDMERGEGDNLIRDINLIFPPQTTNYYKKVVVKDHTYRSSQKRKNHPEKLRWNWMMAEYKENPEWIKRVCTWYFILPEELDLWTYEDWAEAYIKIIDGHPNRIPNPVILRWSDYFGSMYT